VAANSKDCTGKKSFCLNSKIWDEIEVLLLQQAIYSCVSEKHTVPFFSATECLVVVIKPYR